MRNRWNHAEPANTQPCPPDNATGYVMAQVRVWDRLNDPPVPVIHPESAMEIAAWWQASGNGFAPFASTGTIVDGFADEIVAEIERESNPVRPDGFAAGEPTRIQYLAALRALLAYVRACTVSAREIAGKIADEQGWTDETVGRLALTYLIEHTGADTRDRFLAYLRQVQATENES